jgi:hypothetical protein
MMGTHLSTTVAPGESATQELSSILALGGESQSRTPSRNIQESGPDTE